jgi:hypothetical protein
MPSVVKRSASQAVKSGPSRRDMALPRFILRKLSQAVEKPPSGPQWAHEIKLDGFSMPPASWAWTPTSVRAPAPRQRRTAPPRS